MNEPNFYITDVDFRLLVPTGSWHINDVPLDVGKQIKAHFGVSSSFALFSSGAKADPTLVRPEDQVLAGLDWIRYETNPKPGEPDFNVYHYLVGSGSAGKYPVFYCGHGGAIAPGWSTLEDLNAYLGGTGLNKTPS